MALYVWDYGTSGAYRPEASDVTSVGVWGHPPRGNICGFHVVNTSVWFSLALKSWGKCAVWAGMKIIVGVEIALGITVDVFFTKDNFGTSQ